MTQLDQVRALLKSPESVIFVGAGLSIWSGLPSWQELLEKLIEFVEARTDRTQKSARTYLSTKDYLAAADRLLSSIQIREFANFLRNDLAFAAAKPHETHALVTRLGPTCFVTTNYDNLLEKQLQRDGKDTRLVTNVQLADLADIYRANARSFIFKPHGDVNYADSIIITESQYHRLVLGSDGESRSVLKTLEILLATRPVLFLGYGLKDLDLVLLLRKLQATFDKNAGPYWAVMPDVPVDEAAYFWDHFRIRIVSYATVSGRSPADRHAPFVQILKDLCAPLTTKTSSSGGPTDHLLELARYGSRLAQFDNRSHFPLRVHFSFWNDSLGKKSEGYRFNGKTVSTLIQKYSGSCILMGVAGSGKSSAFKTHLSQQGSLIRDWALSSHSSLVCPEVPILLDMRLYDGSFQKLAAASVPPGLDLAKFGASTPILLLLDSLDEMPSEHLQNNAWGEDLSRFSSQFQNVRYIYGTRRDDLVPERGLSVFEIWPLSDGEIKKALRKKKFSARSFTTDFLHLLSTPFVLNLALKMLAPGQRYSFTAASKLFLKFVNQALSTAGLNKSVMLALQKIAFEANKVGRDTIKISQIENVLAKARETSVNRATDLLVGSGLLVSEINGSVRFVHRTILEYLASAELVSLHRKDKLDLQMIFSSRRWDNCIAWATALLTKSELTQIIDAMFKWDPAFTLRLARNVELNRNTLMLQVLKKISPAKLDIETLWLMAREFEATKFPKQSLSELQRISRIKQDKTYGVFRGATIGSLIPLQEEDKLTDWVHQICSGKINYNEASAMCPSLAARVDKDLLNIFLDSFSAAPLKRAYKNNLGDENDDETSQDVRHAIECFIKNLASHFRERVRTWSKNQSMSVRGVVAEALAHTKSPGNLAYLVKEWEEFVETTAAILHRTVRYEPKTKLKRVFGPSDLRVSAMKAWLTRSDLPQDHAIDLLAALCKLMPEWAKAISLGFRGSKSPPLRDVALLISRTSHRNAVVDLITRARIKPDDPYLISLFAFLTPDDFLRNEELLISCIVEAGPTSLSEKLHFLMMMDQIQLRRLSEAEIVKCINLIKRADRTPYLYNFVTFIIGQLDDAGLATVLRIANDKSSPLQVIVLKNLISRMPPTMLSTDDLIPAAAKRLLVLCLKSPNPFLDCRIGEIATEEYIREVVQPFAEQHTSDTTMRDGLSKILRDAGHKHGKRYPDPWLLD